MIEVPDITYKYRSWNDPYHKKILTENEIYFASPNKLNDQKDFKISVSWSLPIKQIKQFADKLARIKGNYSKNTKNILSIRSKQIVAFRGNPMHLHLRKMH